MLRMETAVHPELSTIVRFANTLKDLINAEITIIISDTEKIISQIKASELDFGDIINKPLNEKDPMVGVLQRRKLLIMNVPKEIYGVPFRGAITPLFSTSGELIGSFSVNTTLTNQVDLIDVAGHLTRFSEEMNASTNDLRFSAQQLSGSIEQLAHSKQEMFHQVESSSKMLEMINSVAKNTRILGFNAGIEAARSGEYGKGFSVVAKEITKLADLSADSVSEIRELMLLLKLRVEEVEQIVKKTSEISQHQSESIYDISDAMSNLTEVANKIESLAKKV